MAKARIKKVLFDKCDIAILFDGDRITHWSGMKTNPWLDCILGKRETRISINNKWFVVVPDEWEIFDKTNRTPAEYQQTSKVRHHARARNG